MTDESIRTAREIAEHIILDAISDIEWLTIGEMTEDEADALDEEAYADLRREVDGLITKAVITITFPEGETAK
jgi:vacuolar-type H+-ATPase subunit H